MNNFDPETISKGDLALIIKSALDQRFVTAFKARFDVTLSAQNWDNDFYTYARNRLNDWIEDDGVFWIDTHSWFDIKAYFEHSVDLDENKETVTELTAMTDYISHWVSVSKSYTNLS